MKIIIDDGATMPTRAHETDAGLDIYARETKVVSAKGSAIFDTGVHVEIPRGYAGFIKSRSGLNFKHNIISDGTIDTGYTGSIGVKLYNLGNEDYKVNAGDKIAQLVITSVELCSCERVEQLNEMERASGGFGSTGR